MDAAQPPEQPATLSEAGDELAGLPESVNRFGLGACRRVDRLIQKVEVGVCLAALATMVFLAFAQVLLRQIGGVSLGPLTLPQPVAWFDNIARHMVIWVGVLGASLATAEGRHISIEAVPKLLGPSGRRRVEVLVNLAALLACGTLFGLSWVYMDRVQMPNEAHLFTVEALGLHVYRWPFLAVVPVGLLLMCWRFGLRCAEAVLLDDEAFDALRALENEVEELDVSETGEVAAEAADAPAAEAPTPAGVSEARRALSSSTWDSQEGPIPDEDDLGDEVSEEEPALAEEPPAAPEPKPVGQQPLPSIRSTDEIPIYQDLADTEDLREPELRRGAPLVDSSAELETVAGIEDLVGDPSQATGREAEEAIAAMERSTDRMAPGQEPGTSAPLGLGETATDRLERPELPDPAASEDAPPAEADEASAADAKEAPAEEAPAEEAPADDAPAEEGATEAESGDEESRGDASGGGS